MALKVFNLGCANDHQFEGWFGSGDAFEAQLGQGLVECPMCGDKAIRRLPTAPRLNLSGQTEPPSPPAPGAMSAEQVQALWLRMARHIRENTVDVGDRFAEEARRIHHEREQARGIRGTATREEAEELADEGIEVFSFPMPKEPEGPLQ